MRVFLGFVPKVYSRLVAIILIITLYRMWVTSAVGIKIFNYPSSVAKTFVAFYCLILFFSLFQIPKDYKYQAIIHFTGAVLAGVVFLGRGWGFLDLVVNGVPGINEPRPDLEGAVWERVAMFVLALYYHISSPILVHLSQRYEVLRVATSDDT